MTPDEFRAWRKSIGLTQQQAADRLGAGRRTVQEWEAGTSPIPRHVALACRALAHGLEPWPG